MVRRDFFVASLHSTARCLLLGVMLIGATAAHADDACQRLAGQDIGNTNLLSATLVPVQDGVPEHCRVLGYVRPAINFRIDLPSSTWNHKLLVWGCGGLCGSVDTGDGSELKRGYASAHMDAGHWGESWVDGRWAFDNRVAEVDWAYRAVHETARVTREVARAYYGADAVHAFFSGCSTGGRMAAMAAWKYPEDFDGIICGAPALDYTGLVASFASWCVQVNTDEEGQDILTTADVELLHSAVLAACDAIDGLEDGMIDDPRDCSFQARDLLCREGEEEGCLSPRQVATLNALYQGPRNTAGERLYPGGFTRGSENRWPFWLTGTSDEAGDGFGFLIAKDFLRYMAFQEDPGDSFDVADFDFDRDPPRLAHMGQIYNADHPDLDAFRERGGKLLIYHGWGDGGIPPWLTMQWYEAIEAHVGGRQATQDFARLFLIPGMAHCSQPGYSFDLLSTLEAWVESGDAPAALRVTRSDADGELQWVRDLCPYPARAQYRGGGDPTDPASYECREPQTQ